MAVHICVCIYIVFKIFFVFFSVVLSHWLVVSRCHRDLSHTCRVFASQCLLRRTSLIESSSSWKMKSFRQQLLAAPSELSINSLVKNRQATRKRDWQVFISTWVDTCFTILIHLYSRADLFSIGWHKGT